MNFKTAVLPFLLTLVAVSTSYAAPPIAGGFAPTSISNPDVKLAAKAAVMQHGAKEKESIRLVGIERAEQQVVAGMNYRMTLKIKRGAKAERVKAVVYRDLGGRFALSSWMKAK